MGATEAYSVAITFSYACSLVYINMAMYVPDVLTPGGEASTALLFARNTSQDGHAPSTLPSSKAQPLVRGRNHFYMSLDHCILRTKPGML